MPAQACTIATALKAQGYATGQFGKNHLGDLNKFLPTVMASTSSSVICITSTRCRTRTGTRSRMTQAYRDKHGPRNLVHCWATDTDDTTVMPRWGMVGKQKVVDEGPLAPFPDMSHVPNMHDICRRPSTT